jgi:malonyl-CoA decarboxylase
MAEDERSGRFRRGLGGLQRRWQAIAGSRYDDAAAGLRPDLPPEDRPSLIKQMVRCLEGRGGEVSARAQAAALGRAYLALNEEGREQFLRVLALEFGLDLEAVEAATDSIRKAETPSAARRAMDALRDAVGSPRVRLLTKFNALPQGVKFLVDLRADLLRLARSDPTLGPLEADLKDLLTGWFDVDFLELRRISWDTSSGALLEKFMAYEAVHPVESWEDLKDRLDLDRRYFAFFHPRMPDEPLIFLEVALQEGLSDSIQDLLDPSAPVRDPDRADTAIFYSISNAQTGLSGISFGGFLIKRVVDELSLELPRLKRFATLSPVPGLMAWLLPRLDTEDLFSPSHRKRLAKALGVGEIQRHVAGILQDPGWVRDSDLSEALRVPLLHLAARYLAREKRSDGRALDPVAHFHLNNGARVERLNWMADVSARGLGQSAGIMVNYVYVTSRIEANHEAYRARDRVVVSPAVRSLVKG